jgi:deoxyribodipyrimidine photolyase
VTTLSGEVEKFAFVSKSPLKEHWQDLAAEFTGWESNSQSSLNPIPSMNSPMNTKRKNELKQLLPLKNLSRLKRKIQHSLPDVVSAYEIAKVHPRYKEFFDQPLKSFKEKEKFPGINNKSLLSVYLPSSVDRKVMRKFLDHKNKSRLMEGENRKEKRNRVKVLEPVGKLITVYNSLK